MQGSGEEQRRWTETDHGEVNKKYSGGSDMLTNRQDERDSEQLSSDCAEDQDKLQSDIGSHCSHPHKRLEEEEVQQKAHGLAAFLRASGCEVDSKHEDDQCDQEGKT